MNKLRKFIHLVLHDRNNLRLRMLPYYSKWLTDKKHIELYFKFSMGYTPNLESPKTFNEKLQWLKLYDRRQ